MLRPHIFPHSMSPGKLCRCAGQQLHGEICGQTCDPVKRGSHTVAIVALPAWRGMPNSHR